MSDQGLEQTNESPALAIEVASWHRYEATLCNCTDGKHRDNHWIAYVPLMAGDRMEIARLLERVTETWPKLVAALEHIAEPRLRRLAGSTTCLCCGMLTWHEKDGEVTHEVDCAQQYAERLLNELRVGQVGGAS